MSTIKKLRGSANNTEMSAKIDEIIDAMRVILSIPMVAEQVAKEQLAKHLAVAAKAMKSNNLVAAGEAFRAALELNPKHEAALKGLANIAEAEKVAKAEAEDED